MKISENSHICSICNKDEEVLRRGLYSTCPHAPVLRRLYAIFGCYNAYYEIFPKSGIVNCFAKEHILWGRLTVNYIGKHKSYIWSELNSKVELYFYEFLKHMDIEDTIPIVVADLNEILATINYNPEYLMQLAEHGLCFQNDP